MVYWNKARLSYAASIAVHPAITMGRGMMSPSAFLSSWVRHL